MSRKYRVGIIGSTQHGGYGHGMDTAFQDSDIFEVVAVADDDPTGLAAAGKRLGVTKLYADYREMLDHRTRLLAPGILPPNFSFNSRVTSSPTPPP